ncbi:adipokinetic hormone/corazonin-related peptide-like [Lycorma delicatula]|uniref:adipokinetic hormone/corazonin-related peptide-like n=1 Tax=Lycorma delicatula TaxID=130591 RepID=UPI003F51A4D6
MVCCDTINMMLPSLFSSLKNFFSMENRQAITVFIAISMIMLCLLSRDQFAFGQVTFSRDWTPGKRNGITGNECLVRPTAGALCQMIMNEIRSLAACEAHALVNHMHDDSIDPNRR